MQQIVNPLFSLYPILNFFSFLNFLLIVFWLFWASEPLLIELRSFISGGNGGNLPYYWLIVTLNPKKKCFTSPWFIPRLKRSLASHIASHIWAHMLPKGRRTSKRIQRLWKCIRRINDWISHNLSRRTVEIAKENNSMKWKKRLYPVKGKTE